MRLLVTGSSGFLGQAVMPLLLDDTRFRASELVVWSRQTHGDLLSSAARQAAMETHGPDVVLHMAWCKTGVSGYEHSERNGAWAEATAQFASEATRDGVRFIGIGSMVEEDSEVLTAYANAKREAATAVLETKETLRVWLRPSWIFDFPSLRPRVLRAYAEAQSAGSTFLPDLPGAKKDFIDVKDVASAIQAAINCPVVGIWDVTSGRDTSVASLLRAYDLWAQDHTSISQAGPNAQTAVAHRSRMQSADVRWHPTETARLLSNVWAPEEGQS